MAQDSPRARVRARVQTRSADLSAGAGFRIAGSRRLMHSDDEGHAKMILIDYYHYYYYNVNSWRTRAISDYMESTLVPVRPRWLERRGWELALQQLEVLLHREREHCCGAAQDA
jgi:hypothetical protein